MKQFYLILILNVCLSALYAQESFSVKGKVYTKSGIAVSDATIIIEGKPFQSKSDINGLYSFKNIPKGKYTISVSSLEIQPKKFQINVDKNYTDFRIQVDARDDVALKEVNVTRNTAKREIETSGFAANVIETKDAALRNIQTNELLDRSAGVRLRQNGGIGSAVDYNLNGLSGRSIGIFIDGIDASTYGSSFSLSNIPPAMIERIEVYKGVLPGHLSGDFPGGAINVVMKKGGHINTLSASVSYGSFNTLQSNATGMYRNSKSGLTVNASAFYTASDNDYEVWGRYVYLTQPDGRMEPIRAKRFEDAYKTYGGRFEIGFTGVSWADNFLVGYNGSDAYNEIQHGQFMNTLYKGRFNESQANVFSLRYSKKDFLAKGIDFAFNGAHSMRDSYLQDTVSWNYTWLGEPMLDFDGLPFKTIKGAQQGSPIIQNAARNATSLRANLSYIFNPNHKLLVNYNYYIVGERDSDRIEQVAGRDKRVTSDLTKGITSFTYDMKTLGQRLQTNLFAKLYEQRINRRSPSNHEISKKNRTGYGLAVSYAITPHIMLLGSAERAVRMPDESELFGRLEDNIIANPLLNAETSDNLNLGFRLGSYNFDKHRIFMSASGFVRNGKDKIKRKPDYHGNEAVHTAGFENLGLTQSIGFESELNYNYDNKLIIGFNLSKFNTLYKKKIDPASGGQLDNYNKQIYGEPFFTMNSNVQYRLENVFQKRSALNLYYGFGYVSPFYFNWIEVEYFKNPKQFIQDLGASYTLPSKKIVVSLDAKNIFNHQAHDNFGVQKPGRAFYLKLNYTINKF